MRLPVLRGPVRRLSAWPSRGPPERERRGGGVGLLRSIHARNYAESTLLHPWVLLLHTGRPLRASRVWSGYNMDPSRDATGHPRVSVLIVADVRLYRESLALMLSSRGFVSMAGAATRMDGLTKVRELRPGVAIVDIASRGAL